MCAWRFKEYSPICHINRRCPIFMNPYCTSDNEQTRDEEVRALPNQIPRADGGNSSWDVSSRLSQVCHRQVPMRIHRQSAAERSSELCLLPPLTGDLQTSQGQCHCFGISLPFDCGQPMAEGSAVKYSWRDLNDPLSVWTRLSMGELMKACWVLDRGRGIR